LFAVSFVLNTNGCRLPLQYSLLSHRVDLPFRCKCANTSIWVRYSEGPLFRTFRIADPNVDVFAHLHLNGKSTLCESRKSTNNYNPNPNYNTNPLTLTLTLTLTQTCWLSE